MNILGMLVPARRAVLPILVAVITVQGVLVWKQGHDLEVERKTSTDLNQEIMHLERLIRLTERLREYTGEITREAADLEGRIDRAAGTEDRLSPDLVRVLERLRSTAPGPAGSP